MTIETQVLGMTRDRARRARQLFAEARRERFAVIAFNVDSQDTVHAVVRAAAALRAPLLVAVDEEEASAIGLANLRAMVDNYNDELGTEVYLHLDRAPTVAAAKAGIDAGFEVVHLALSRAVPSATDEEVILATREVVRHARTTGAMVEGEPNSIAAAASVFDDAIDYAAVRKTYSTPLDAAAFVAATGVDVFAANLRALRFDAATPPTYDLGLLERVCDAVDVTVSLNSGSTGVPGHLLTEAASFGVGKVSLRTELRRPFRGSLERQLQVHLDEDAMPRLMPPVVAAVQRAAEEHIARFGVSGRAAA